MSLEELVASIGYKLITSPRTGKQKFRVQCNNGHQYETRSDALKAGKRCGFCYGNRRKSISEITQVLESSGYVLLSTVYINATTKLDLKCPGGHITQLCWNSFRNGHRCPECFSPTKVPDQQIMEYLTQFRMELVERGSRGRLLVRCLDGHEKWTTKSYLARGHGCRQCSSGRKKTLAEIKMIAAQEGYEILSEVYTNVDTPDLTIRCPNGHEYNLQWNRFQQGKRCVRCRVTLWDLSNLDKYLDEIGYKRLSAIEIWDVQLTVRICCDRGHEYETRIQNVIGKSRCPHCAFNRKTFEEVEGFLESHGYKLLSESYRGTQKPIEVECPKGHSFSTRFGNFQYSTYCPGCNISLGEKQLAEFLKSRNVRFETSRRGLIGRHELDIYLPDFKLALEYCGLWWHSHDFVDSGYHLRKLQKCLDRGISLITIFEDEWIHNRKKVESVLLARLGLNEVVYARDTRVSQVRWSETSAFLAEFHLLGPVPGKLYTGLYLGDCLVMVMVFSHHHRNTKDTVLSRMCTRSGMTVSGGASKLLTFARSILRGNIVTFADRRWSEGSVYLKMGFKKEAVLRPDYSYADPDARVRYSKQSMRKTESERDKKLTERQLRLPRYKQIYDCGKIRYRLCGDVG